MRCLSLTSDALLIVRTLFVSIWSLFTSWHIPGTRATPAEMGFLILTVSLLLRFLKRLLSVDGGDDNA